MQIPSNVDNRIAFALPFFKTEILAIVMPTFSANSVTLIFRLASITSMLMMIGMLISGEIIFAAASLNFMAVNRFFAPDPAAGQIFVLFIMGLAAAEVAIALSIIIAVYRNYRSIASAELSELKG